MPRDISNQAVICLIVVQYLWTYKQNTSHISDTKNVYHSVIYEISSLQKSIIKLSWKENNKQKTSNFIKISDDVATWRLYENLRPMLPIRIEHANYR